jgi:peptidoglycan/xylan/chitin deacetylase (PgdA/CDA1 family)
VKFVRPPLIYRTLFPYLIWKIPASEKTLYLTFDDGPVPGVTSWVLEELKKYNAKATFFCIGENIKKHPALYEEILKEGHATGNHTFNHLNAWKTPADEYLVNVAKAATLCKSSLFRPPYGMITFATGRKLRLEYKIVMWDVLSYDFDSDATPEKCLSNVTSNAGNGSVIVFHDSLKAEKNMRFALTGTLEYFTGQGFRFEAISFK